MLGVYSLSWLFSAIMALVLVGGIVYLILKPREKTGTGHRDAYFYIVMFLALLPLFWAVADLGRVILERVWDVGTRYYPIRTSGDVYLRQISLRMSALVVALPIYAFHWYKAGGRKKEDMDWESRRLYTAAVLILSTALVLTVGIWLVYNGFNLALGVEETGVKQQLAYALPYTLASLAVWGWHFKMWREEGKPAAAPKPMAKSGS